MKNLRFGILPAFLVGAIFLIFVSWAVVGVSQVSGPSMKPRYHSGQIIFINRWAYGLPNPIIGGYWWFWKAPRIGDPVILKDPADGKLIVKRIAGVSGTTLRVMGKKLLIGQRVVPLSDAEAYWLSSVSNVPSGMVFVLGDNSSVSEDSRDWGFIPQTQVLGRLLN
ncbi:MAG: signal peptidase I [Spirochaetales bacterium]|nr:signal peptidase I [Spirochaetales bacterium]